MWEGVNEQPGGLIDSVRVVRVQRGDDESRLLSITTRTGTQDSRLPIHDERPKAEPGVQLHAGLN
jgi:hypothetical protein